MKTYKIQRLKPELNIPQGNPFIVQNSVTIKIKKYEHSIIPTGIVIQEHNDLVLFPKYITTCFIPSGVFFEKNELLLVGMCGGDVSCSDLYTIEALSPIALIYVMDKFENVRFLEITGENKIIRFG